MTVYSVLRLNETTGMGCADERVSVGGRTYDTARKIRKLTDHVFVGYSGSISFADGVTEDLPKNERGYDALVNALAASYRGEWRGLFDREAVSNGTTWDEVKSLKDMNPRVKDRVLRGIENLKRHVYTSFILAGYDEGSKRFRINVIDEGGDHIVNPFAPVGSGSDQAHVAISEYLHNMTPEERERIPLWKGARILMEATKKAWHNIGVGGRSQVVWASEKGISELGYRESNVLHNLLYLESKRIFDQDHVDGVFCDVVERGAKAEDVLKALEGKISTEVMIKLFFEESLHL